MSFTAITSKFGIDSNLVTIRVKDKILLLTIVTEPEHQLFLINLIFFVANARYLEIDRII